MERKHSNVDAIYHEYPFVQRFLPRAIAEIVTVSRWDKEFLQKPNVLFSDLTYEEHDPYPSPKTTYGFYLLDEDGKEVTEVGERKKGFWHRLFSIPDLEENVGQALYRLGAEARRVHYAVRYHGKVLCLFKIPREYKNAEDWLNAVNNEEREAMRQI